MTHTLLSLSLPHWPMSTIRNLYLLSAMAIKSHEMSTFILEILQSIILWFLDNHMLAINSTKAMWEVPVVHEATEQNI